MHTDIRELLKEAKIERKNSSPKCPTPSFDFVKREHL
jgi:hypothetical protein